MRLLTYAALVLLVGVAVAATGLRWLGMQRSPAGLPLPDEHGCWQSACFLDGRSLNGVVSALRAQPGVPVASVRALDELQGGDFQSVAFDYAPRPIGAVPVLLFWSPYTYNFVLDWRVGASRPLLHFGDVIVALGRPRRLVFTVNSVVLTYPDRGLRVTVERSRASAPWAFLSPADPVVSISVTRQEPNTMGAIYYQPNFPWRGFGAYQLEE